MPYDPNKSPVSEEVYNKNVARSQAAMTAAGPMPAKAGPEWDAWRQKADAVMQKSAEEIANSVLEKIGMLPALLSPSGQQAMKNTAATMGGLAKNKTVTDTLGAVGRGAKRFFNQGMHGKVNPGNTANPFQRHNPWQGNI
jgi:delta-aminolevulinic acid dehydratase/porphobilinogen synthase